MSRRTTQRELSIIGSVINPGLHCAMTIRKGQALFARALYVVGEGLLAIVRKVLWPRKRPESARNICVYRVGNVGDTACALPAIYAIRLAYPNARMTLVTSPGLRGAPDASELLGGASWLDEIFIYHLEDVAGLRPRLRLVRELRSRGFDLWFEIPHEVGFCTALRNMLVARAIGTRWGYGWRVGRVPIALQAQSEFHRPLNQVDKLMGVVAAAGLPHAAPSFPLPITGEHRRKIDRLLSAHGFLHRPLVAIAPAAKRSPNRWPVARFAEVVRHLSERGICVVVLGGPSDSEICGEVARAAGAAGLSMAGRASLLESCEMLRRCRLLICNDSGVQHLAAAVGTQCVSLFSFRDLKGRWWPYGSQHIVLQKWVECHSCLLENCPYDNLCIKSIAADEVIAAADRVLSEIGAPPASYHTGDKRVALG